MKKTILPLSMLLLLVGCSAAPETKPGTGTKPLDEVVTTQMLNPEIVTDELRIPWQINKTGSTFYLSERPGSIVKFENGKKVRQRLVLEKKLALVPEAGFLGFVLAPDFSKSKKAYGYYTYEDQTGRFNRVVELELKEDVWRERKWLLDKIPSDTVHHGGRIKIGPDDKLYVTTGDAQINPAIAQDLNSLGGKILRMNLDGTIPNDNPFPRSYVYSYGHRNPQGLAWDSQNSLFASEHGPEAHDEINEIEPGKNYGWPMIVGAMGFGDMKPPFFESGKETWAPSGMAFYKNKLYVATLRGNAVREFDFGKMTTSIVVTGLGRIRDIFIEGDTLYFVTNNTDGRGVPAPNDDKLYRVELHGRAE